MGFREAEGGQGNDARPMGGGSFPTQDPGVPARNVGKQGRLPRLRSAQSSGRMIAQRAGGQALGTLGVTGMGATCQFVLKALQGCTLFNLRNQQGRRG